MSKKNRVLAKVAILGGLFFASSQASAVSITTNTGSTEYIPGVTTFLTHGDDMVGLKVTATFSDATYNDTLSWKAAGAGSGGVSGAGWSLSESGDTFNSPWVFSNNTGANLLSLVLDGSEATGGGSIIFDRTEDYGGDSVGTANSSWGEDIALSTNALRAATLLEYSVQVGIDSNGPWPAGDGDAQPVEGDLWHILTMEFANGLGELEWSFVQDTDNDTRHEVPEPASIALMALGLVGLGSVRRRTRC